MLTNIKKRPRSIDAHFALLSMLHFAVPELKSMEEVESPIGQKQASREPDLRWGADAAQTPVNYSFQETQQQTPSEDPQPMCAAAAMMHRSSRGTSSSWQGGCPPRGGPRPADDTVHSAIVYLGFEA